MKFDYIIIGAGSAGCVLANRLTENMKNRVAVFEAGKHSDIWKVKMPLALLYTMHDKKYNWKYYSEPEPYLNNRKLFCPRGKMIGGCSAHNGMVFVRGNRNDYERWESFGLKSCACPLTKTIPLCDEHPPTILPLGQKSLLLFKYGSGSE